MLDDFDMLAATLAHEMKNPLALVRANLDYIELCDTEKRHSESCLIMKKQLEKTDTMLKDFVGLMSATGGAEETVNLAAAVSSVVEDYSAVRLDTELPPELMVRGNPRMLAIVISNAVKNSIEAGAERIRIRGYREKGRARLTITDDGQGLSDYTLERLNDDCGYTTKKYGNGLGVFISRKITEGGGGSYRIDNADGGGCEVSIELPLAE